MKQWIARCLFSLFLAGSGIAAAESPSCLNLINAYPQQPSNSLSHSIAKGCQSMSTGIYTSDCRVLVSMMHGEHIIHYFMLESNQQICACISKTTGSKGFECHQYDDL